MFSKFANCMLLNIPVVCVVPDGFCPQSIIFIIAEHKKIDQRLILLKVKLRNVSESSSNILYYWHMKVLFPNF